MRASLVSLDIGHRAGGPAVSRRRGRGALALALGGVGMASGRSARADMPRDTPAAIEVDRDVAPAGRVGFGFDGGEPVEAWGASIAAGWIEQPIRLGSGTFGSGSPATEPVRRRETLSLGGALALGDSVVIDARLRASHQIGDRLLAAGNPEKLARYVFHDVRFGGRLRFAGNRDRAAMLGAELTLPTGNAGQFAGDARWTAAWSLIGRVTIPHDIVIAGNVGIRLHGAEVAVGDRLVGDELFAAAGVAVPLSAAGLTGVAEQVAATGELAGALGDHVGKFSGPSPLEARVGVIVRALPALTLGARVGFGLDDQIGAPGVRAVLAVAWTPPLAQRAAPAPPASSPSSPPALPASPVPPPDDEPDDDEPDDGGGGTR